MKGARLNKNLVGLSDGYKFNKKKLDQVGYRLENPKGPYTVGPYTVLHKSTDLSFGIHQKQPHDRIKNQDDHTCNNHFSHNRPCW